MIRYLLPKEGRFYKANLHSHTTFSDGNWTPEEMKQQYKAHGYDILAITDHELMRTYNDMTEPDFLMLNGYEAYIKESRDSKNGRAHKTVHLNLIAKTPDVDKMIMVDPDYCKYHTEDIPVESRPRVGEICTRQYTPGCVNRFVRLANENGYYVVYNHPSWSREGIEVVKNYTGFTGMEVYNHGCLVEGYPGDDSKFYDEFIRRGDRLIAFANDDNHDKYPDTQWADSFGGWNMIKAEKLDYETIIAAILKAELYCSTGATITGLWVEDGVLHVTSDDARDIILITEPRPKARGRMPFRRANPGEVITHAEFPILPEDGYVRIEVTNKEGFKAWTSAYFTEDLLK
ncbi:MAG: PHP domain-containing protein [Clostridia bacterium]|nr:PHP domain-containing protein [Clostridia bacterium]